MQTRPKWAVNECDIFDFLVVYDVEVEFSKKIGIKRKPRIFFDVGFSNTWTVNLWFQN